MDTTIAYCKIHPGIGIARVGNSPDGFFIGPEAPGVGVSPAGGFKDASGRIKRQAARFRIYAYNAAGEVLKELTARDAEITWTAHLANKKGAYHEFGSRFRPKKPLRNIDTQPGITNPELRTRLIIDPGARSIGGVNKPAVRFDGGMFAPQSTEGNVSTPVEVPLGELRTDAAGRLLVLGGYGKSTSTVPGTGITEYANNDFWHDDTSDGPVTARVVLKGDAPIELPVTESSWVLVTPPKFAPDLNSVVTLYDVMEEVAIDRKWITPADDDVRFMRDIYPIFKRICGIQWVNASAYRGHSPGAPGDLMSPKLLTQLASKGPATEHLRRHVFGRIRNPNLPQTPPEGSTAEGTVRASSDDAVSHFIARTGDSSAAQAAPGDLAAQGAYDESVAQASFSFMPIFAGDGGDSDPRENDPERWQRILVRQYALLKRWAEGDFIEDLDLSPPAPPATLGRYSVAEQPGALDRAALEPCIGGPFYPGIEITYIVQHPSIYGEPDVYGGPFRLNPAVLTPGDITQHMAVPWQADFNECSIHWWPAQRPDDVVTSALYNEVVKALETSEQIEPLALAQMLATRELWTRGIRQYGTDSTVDIDMVEHWHSFGFITARVAPNGETVHIEGDRDPYFGKRVRDFFYIMLNIENYPDFLPKARKLAQGYLDTTWAQRDDKDNGGQLSFFRYTKEALAARLNLTYNALVSDAAAYNPATDPDFRTREDVVERIRQFAPVNQLDGSWLRNVARGGPIDEVRATLFSIYQDETGNGLISQNHCNLYTTLLETVDIFLPPIESRAYADRPDLLDASFDAPLFMLVMSQFTEELFPEILGMTLNFEWSVVDYQIMIKLMEYFGMDPHYYVLHVGIDNADSGHGALARGAVEIFLDGVRSSEGEEAMQQAWYRVWRGYVGMGLVGNLGAALLDKLVDNPPSLEDRMVALITAKKPYGQLNHGEKKLGVNKINDWFEDPAGFLAEMVRSRLLVPGDPDNSPFFQVMSFDGPMYRVFTDDEVALWRSYVYSLADSPTAAKPAPIPYDHGAQMVHVIHWMKQRQSGVGGHHVKLRGPNPRAPGETISQSIHDWFNLDLGSDEANATALMAALANEENGWVVRHSSATSPLVQNLLGGAGAMAKALSSIAPETRGMTRQQATTLLGGNPPEADSPAGDPSPTTGLTFAEVVALWIDAGCPMPRGAAIASLAPRDLGPARLGAAADTAPKAKPTFHLRRRKHGMGAVH
jgi:hypothetical protein